VTFAANVGIELLGEGIERHEELETLRSLGVRYGQGFLLGRPMSLSVEQAGEDAITSFATSASPQMERPPAFASAGA
jgi:EAL domain-containing protein (putative c-di-GMP-specific phosphodiesterase class I)